MQSTVRSILAVFIAAALSACATIAPPKPIERMVVFGDSNVDTGNLFRLSGNKHPQPPNWRGRNSNGPNVVEYLSKDLGAKLEDYAVSGATSGQSNIVGRLAPSLASVESTGVAWQIGEFAKTGSQLGNKDVVVIWAGSNDIYGISRVDASGLQRKISEATANMVDAIDRLYRLGARRFVIATRTPREVVGNENDMNGVDLNRALVQAVKSAADRTGATVTVFDAYTSVSDMMMNPSRYGFTNVGALCTAVPECVAERFEDGLKIANGYVNWDAAHKTTRVHRLMADQLLQTLRQ